MKSADNLQEIASRQLADYDARRPGTIFSEPEVTADFPNRWGICMSMWGRLETCGRLLIGLSERWIHRKQAD
jgi:hypothetical protein